MIIIFGGSFFHLNFQVRQTDFIVGTGMWLKKDVAWWYNYNTLSTEGFETSYTIFWIIFLRTTMSYMKWQDVSL